MPQISITNKILRPLAVHDIAFVSALLPALLPGDWSMAALQELMRSSHQSRVLCVNTAANADVAGFAEFLQVLDEGHLFNIAIGQGWQGSGLGRDLLAGILAEMQSLGCTRCLLEVRRSNVRAIRFYERAGFTLDGIRKNYYPPLQNGGQPEDALLYSLSLGGSS